MSFKRDVQVSSFNMLWDAAPLGIQLGAFIRRYVPQDIWRPSMQTRNNDEAFDPMRRILSATCPTWIELVCGMSYRMYRGVEVYMRVYYPCLAPIRNSLYVVCTHNDPSRRQFLYPEQWVHGVVWNFHGETERWDDWRMISLCIAVQARI